MAGTSFTIFLPDDATPDTYAFIAYRDPNDPRRLSTSLRSQPYAITSAISAGSQAFIGNPWAAGDECPDSTQKQQR